MSNPRYQKPLAASKRGCGKKKVLPEPNETGVIANANSRPEVRVWLKGLIHEPTIILSKYMKLEGRHCGFGKRKGTRNARTPPKEVWITPPKELWVRLLQILRRCLRGLRKINKIDQHVHIKLYLKVKGKAFKNKRVLPEFTFNEYPENASIKFFRDDAEAQRECTRRLLRSGFLVAV